LLALRWSSSLEPCDINTLIRPVANATRTMMTQAIAHETSQDVCLTAPSDSAT